MPWLVNVGAVERMLRAADKSGWIVDSWWRDEDRLAAYWLEHSFPDATAGAAAIWAGDQCVAMVGRTLSERAADDQPLMFWTIYSLTPIEIAQSWINLDDIRKADVAPGVITQWNAIKFLNEPKQPAAVGDRVACRWDDARGKIGLCRAVDELGRVTMVEDEPGVEPVPAIGYSRRWFKLDQRDEAFDWFWQTGKTAFPHYINMLAQLANKQRQLLKGGRVKPGRAAAPDLPARRAAVERTPAPEPIQPPANPAVEAFAEAYSTGLLCPAGVGADRNPFTGRDPIKAAGWLAGWEHSAANSG